MADVPLTVFGLIGGIAAAIIFLWILIVGVAVFAVVFWIWMLIDAAMRNFKHDSDKIIWVIIIVFTQIIGAIIYYFLIKRHNRH